MGGSGVTALRNGTRQTRGQERMGSRAQSPGLGPTSGLATVDGLIVIIPGLHRGRFAQPKLGQRDDGKSW